LEELRSLRHRIQKDGQFSIEAIFYKSRFCLHYEYSARNINSLSKYDDNSGLLEVERVTKEKIVFLDSPAILQRPNDWRTRESQCGRAHGENINAAFSL
jgi:hypothetical protein